MMKSKYRKLICSTAVVASVCLLASCNEKIDGTPKEEKILVPETPYESFYKNSHTGAYQSDEVGEFFMSSHGYSSKREQGYNGWFYKYKKDSLVSEMPLENNEFSFENAHLIDSEMKSTTEVFAVRELTISQPKTYRICSSISILKSTGNVVVSIYKGNELLKKYEIDPNIQTTFYNEFEVSFFIGQTIRFVLESDSTIEYNPVLEASDHKVNLLHPTLTGIFPGNGLNRKFGDVHPYYDNENGKMYFYYLDSSGQYNQGLVTSTDMIYYNEDLITTNPDNPPTSKWYVYGIVKIGDYYYSHPYRYQKYYMPATRSKDLHTWENASEIDLEKGTITYGFKSTMPGMGRDPYTIYDPDIDAYRVIYLGYRKERSRYDIDASLVVATSKDNSLKEFKTKEREILRFDHAGESGVDEPECPMMAKIGDRWYVFGSIYGRSMHGVGALSYWMSDPHKTIDNADFEKNGEHQLDGEDLCAAQLTKIGDRWYMYGWIPPADLWGGSYNIAREVYQRPDGTLATRLDPYITSLLNKGNMYNLKMDNMDSGSCVISNGSLTFKGAPQTDCEIENHPKIHKYSISGDYRRVLIEGTVDSTNCNVFGIKVEDGEGHFNYIYYDKTTGTMYATDNTVRYGHFTKSKFENVTVDGETHFKIVLEGRFCEFFINDEYSLSADYRSEGESDSKGYEKFNVSLISDGSDVTFSQFDVNMLSDAKLAYEM